MTEDVLRSAVLIIDIGLLLQMTLIDVVLLGHLVDHFSVVATDLRMCLRVVALELLRLLLHLE